MATVQMDIREIRQCVYGRDMREPIIDALKHIRNNSTDQTNWMEELTHRLEMIPRRIISSVIADPQETWYTYDYENIQPVDILGSGGDITADVVKNGAITVSLLDGSDYRAVNGLNDATASLIESEDYQWNIPNPITHTYPHHGEDYTMVFNFKTS